VPADGVAASCTSSTRPDPHLSSPLLADDLKMRVGPGVAGDGGSVKPGEIRQTWPAARLVLTDSMGSAAGRHAHLLVARPGRLSRGRAGRLVLTGLVI
jgi:hypothetical protein